MATKRTIEEMKAAGMSGDAIASAMAADKKANGPTSTDYARWGTQSAKQSSNAEIEKGLIKTENAKKLARLGGLLSDDGLTYTSNLEIAKSGGRLPGFEGALDTQVGKTLEGNILDSLGGQMSNQLIQARATGNEALARKAGDIRGLAAQNTIQSGNLGQGSASRARMGAELEIMQNLGDFQGQIAQAGADEQAGARTQALQLLGLKGQDLQIEEMKRQSLVSEDQAEKLDNSNYLLGLIDRAVDPGTKQELTSSAVEELLGGPLSEEAVLANEKYAKELEQASSIQNLINNLNPSQMTEKFSIGEDGQWQMKMSDGSIIDIGITGSEILSANQATLNEAMADPEFINKNYKTMSADQLKEAAYKLTQSELMNLNTNSLRTLVEEGVIGGTTGFVVDTYNENTYQAPDFSAENLKAKGVHTGDVVYIDGETYILGSYQSITRQDGSYQVFELKDEQNNVVKYVSSSPKYGIYSDFGIGFPNTL